MHRALQPIAIPAVAGLLLLLPLPSGAAESVRTDGATLSLVAVPPGANGELRAALRVELMPGWKTYWLDPGDAGIPPQLDFSRSTGITEPKAVFPAPVRFEEGGGASSTGYVASFSIAIEGNASPSKPASLDIRITLGLCRELCVPVVAELSIDPARARGADVLAKAFAALPHQSGPGDGIASLRLSADAKALEVAVEPTSLAARADVFVAAPGWFFGAPAAGQDGMITLPVLRKPRKPGPLPEAEAVLVTKDGSFRTTARIGKVGG